MVVGCINRKILMEIFEFEIVFLVVVNGSSILIILIGIIIFGCILFICVVFLIKFSRKDEFLLKVIYIFFFVFFGIGVVWGVKKID